MNKYFLIIAACFLYAMASAQAPGKADTAKLGYYPIEWREQKIQPHRLLSANVGIGVAIPVQPNNFKGRNLAPDGYLALGISPIRRLTLLPVIEVEKFSQLGAYGGSILAACPGLHVRGMALEIASRIGLFGCAGAGMIINTRHTDDSYFLYQYGVGVALLSEGKMQEFIMVRNQIFHLGGEMYRVIPITVGVTF